MANHSYLTGRLTGDPELRSKGELDICRMRVAVQRRRGKDGEDRGAFFIDVTAFNGQAGVCAKYLHKGSRVLVAGQLDVQEWTGEDDVKRWTPKIIAEQVEFLDSPARKSEQEPPAPQQETTPQQDSPEQSEQPKARRRGRAKAAA